MKINENVYCKKTLIHHKMIYFKCDNFYSIERIVVDNDIYLISVSDELLSAIEFDLSKPDADEYKFNDYFYTEKEYRKIKLEKLQCLK